MWSWCTRDSPEPIDDSMTTDMTGDSTTPKPVEGQKRVKSVNDDNNCMLTNFETGGGGLGANLCEAKSVYLACESVEKLTADLLVLFSMQQSVYRVNILIPKPDTKCRAKCPSENTCKKNVKLYLF